MSAIANYPHISIDADGSARIGQTRYKVVHLAAEHHSYGWSAEELLRQHPDLNPKEVYAALTYFYDHFDELLAKIKAAAATIDERRTSQPLSRAELLKRQQGGSA